MQTEGGTDDLFQDPARNGEGEERLRKSLVFFAPDWSDPLILAAYDVYLQALEASGRFDITVMAPNHSPFADKARAAGVRLHPLSDFARKLLLRAPQLWPILTATRRFRFDVALCHEAYAIRGFNQVARKVVAICHDDRFDWLGTSHRLVVLTSGAFDMARDVLGKDLPIDILPYPHAVRHKTIKPLPDNDTPLTIGTSAPFLEGDGLGAFIHMAQLLHQSAPEARFVVAGTGPTEHDMKDLADTIAPFIDFAGPLDRDELVEAIDIFCLTEPYSPYSLTLCDMMDAGLACVSTCTHGPMDILKGGMVAPLVPIGDAFLLAVELQELLEDRPRIERIKKACFERIREEDFWPDLFAERLADILER